MDKKYQYILLGRTPTIATSPVSIVRRFVTANRKLVFVKPSRTLVGR